MKTPRKTQVEEGTPAAPSRELKGMVCIKMQPSLKVAAQQYAKANGMTFAELVRYALQLYLDTHAEHKP